MINATVPMIAYSAITAIIGMWGVAMSMIGYCQSNLNTLQRILFFIGGLCMIIPGTVTDIAGITSLVAAFMWQRMNK